jgi:hypothetical protein
VCANCHTIRTRKRQGLLFWKGTLE